LVVVSPSRCRWRGCFFVTSLFILLCLSKREMRFGMQHDHAMRWYDECVWCIYAKCSISVKVSRAFKKCDILDVTICVRDSGLVIWSLQNKMKLKGYSIIMD
jgi:hypothetical protein